jgi:DNA-directed RNA polymerase specialized sigma24 family protein
MMKKNKLKFEKNLDLINTEILKRKNKWTLSALNWIDFEDVSQIVRFHLYKKWDLYDDSKPMLPWINRIISNQIKNIIRNNYGNYARPCLKCAASLGDSGCKIYGEQNAECPMYENWKNTKKNAYDIKMAVSIEDHPTEINNRSQESLDIQKATANLNIVMQKVLKPMEWQVYDLLYIQLKSEEQVCRVLKLKFDKKSKTGYNKQLRNIQKSIIKKAKLVIKNGEVDL